MKKISYRKIEEFFCLKLNQINLKKDVIESTVNSLIEASLFGIDSHGVNLFEHYYQCLIKGRIKKDNNSFNKIFQN